MILSSVALALSLAALTVNIYNRRAILKRQNPSLKTHHHVHEASDHVGGTSVRVIDWLSKHSSNVDESLQRLARDVGDGLAHDLAPSSVGPDAGSVGGPRHATLPRAEDNTADGAA